ncbi:MAG: alpha/beta-type small acid-soluble spore protein [Clostridia bacterium]|nr:alpha/beta-type small acid-soluble spore protein [Clostridia bacterium]
MARNRSLVPGAKGLLDAMKYETSKEVGVNLKEGYNGDLTAREAGKVGGNMVRKMISQAEKQLSGK